MGLYRCCLLCLEMTMGLVVAPAKKAAMVMSLHVVMVAASLEAGIVITWMTVETTQTNRTALKRSVRSSVGMVTAWPLHPGNVTEIMTVMTRQTSRVVIRGT